MEDRAGKRRPRRLEHGVRRDKDIIAPALRARIHSTRPRVLHGVGDLDLFPRKGRGGRGDTADHQVRWRVGNRAGGGARIVLGPRPLEDQLQGRLAAAGEDLQDLACAQARQIAHRELGQRAAQRLLGALQDAPDLFEEKILLRRRQPRIDIGFDNKIRARGRGRQRESRRLGVTLVERERARVRHRENKPLLPLPVIEVGVGREPDRIGPTVAVGRHGPLVGHRPRDGHFLATGGRGRRAHLGYHKIGGRREKHLDGHRLEVIPFQVIRRIRIHIRAQGRLVHALPAIRPHREEKLARQIGRQPHRGRGVIKLTHIQHPLVADGPQINVPPQGARAVLPARQPDMVAPRSGIGRATPLVLHRVADSHRVAVKRLARPGHRRHHQIRRRHRRHVDRDRARQEIVAIQRGFIDAAIGIGHHDDKKIAAKGARQIKMDLRRITVAGFERQPIGHGHHPLVGPQPGNVGRGA